MSESMLLDPMIILDLLALTLTVACLVGLLVANLAAGRGEARTLQLEHLRRFRSTALMQHRFLRLFEVGALISTPKRSLAGQRLG